MILVRRDTGLIPKKVLDVAARAQSKLEALPPDQRSEFIKKKSHIWRAFGRYLAQMSFKKCWYSEALDLHSFHDIDHFRPKLEAKRADGTVGPGYDWLAFSWQNFRYSATCANRLLTVAKVPACCIIKHECYTCRKIPFQKNPCRPA